MIDAALPPQDATLFRQRKLLFSRGVELQSELWTTQGTGNLPETVAEEKCGMLRLGGAGRVEHSDLLRHLLASMEM